MIRRRRPTISRTVFNAAKKTLPPPVQFALGSPFRFFLAVLILGLLISYGVVTVTWQEGRPQLQVDQQRAAELKQDTAEWVEQRIEERFTDEESEDNPLVRAARQWEDRLRRD